MLGIIVLSLMSISLSLAQDKLSQVVFYNVENLFDTIPSNKYDYDFSPLGNKRWNSYRYFQKQRKLYKVLSNISQNAEFPVLIGLCEVENRTVLNDLTCKTPLIKARYKIIHFDSPDKRGIDVALLYQSERFIPLYTEAIKPQFDNPNKTTRDILYVKGILNQQDTLHIFVNHWPSKYGGEANTVKYRNAVGKSLKLSCEAIGYDQNIIILGDLNDQPEAECISEILGASMDLSHPSAQLFNLMHYEHQNKGWTHSGNNGYYTEQSIIDHCIISKSMLKDKSNKNQNLSILANKAFIFNLSWLLHKDALRSKRTFYGFKYEGGYSDHLPVYFYIRQGRGVR